jgi:hypothetical protein
MPNSPGRPIEKASTPVSSLTYFQLDPRAHSPERRNQAERRALATPLSRTDAQVEHIRGLDYACMLLAPTILRRMGNKVDGSLVSLRESGRLAQDIILGVLCGVSGA